MAKPRHFLSVLSKEAPAPFTKGSGRLELADAILQQPIATRVIVNRIWKGHFGSGIVDSPSNFGMTGERPTNPDLLEHLAYSFSRNGLSIKKLHREIMLTSVYQLSTESNPVALAKDSGNRLYWRADRKRMDAEQVRDSILLVSGDLDHAVGGPSADLTPSFKRRTVYGKVSRYKLDEYLQLFDFPSPNLSAEKRFVTTVPLQRLFLMNSDFMQLEAEELAKRVATEPTNRARIRKVYQTVFNRDASEEEVALGLEYLKAEPMLEYEEGKKRPPAEGAPGMRRGRGGPASTGPSKDSAPPAEQSEQPASAEPVVALDTAPGDAAAPGEALAGAPAEFGMGMMGGMGRRGPGGPPSRKLSTNPPPGAAMPRSC